MRVFVSHSSKDVTLATPIVELIRKSTRISSTDILCSSIDGYRLPAGAATNEFLRTEVYGSELLIGLITPNALNSLFVAFELGARWGASKLMIPLLASGATVDDLEGPLADINALECNSRSQINQFAENVASYLSTPLEPPSSFVAEVESVYNASIDLQEETQQTQMLGLFGHIESKAFEILLAATEEENGHIQLIKAMGGYTHLSAGKKTETVEGHRPGSEWESAIRQLEQQGWIIDHTGNGRAFEVTGEGYAVADELGKQP